jgi:putative tryptophan/tyrosine transport system substrate-binding protein
MDRRMFLSTLGGGLLAAPLAAGAQQAGKVWRIGFLTSGFTEGTGSDVRLAPFLQGLRELGYIEGRNVILEIRYAEGRAERFPALAAELVSFKVDVLVATSTPGALAAKQATSTIPIVMAAVGEPVEVRLVESLAHPGGNITGLSLIAPLLAAKRLVRYRDRGQPTTHDRVCGEESGARDLRDSSVRG